MPYLLGIAVVAAVSFGAVVIHDPDAGVRIWGVVGMCGSFVSAAIAVCNMGPKP